MKFDLTSFIKSNSKWLKDLNVRAKIIILLELNIDITLCDLGLDKANNEKIDKVDIIKTLLYQRLPPKKLKTPHRMGENICKTYI